MILVLAFVGQAFLATWSTSYWVFVAGMILALSFALLRRNILVLSEDGLREHMGNRTLFEYSWNELKEFEIIDIKGLSTIGFKVKSKGDKVQTITNVYKVDISQILEQIQTYQKATK